MIYTCTLNPSIDYVIGVDDFKEGQINRTKNENMFPGGKGINVSRVLKRLGADSTAIGFTAGFTGSFIEDFLAEEQITSHFIPADGYSRINIKLKSSTETEINGQGPEIRETQKLQLLKKISALQEGDILVLAGSIPKSLGEDFYREAAQIARDAGVKTVIDAFGNALKNTFSMKPFLIKPNHHELGELFGTDIRSAEDAVKYGRRLLDEGVQNVIVSMAGDGAVFINQESAFIANVPSGEIRNSVGAGDSVVAGFLAGYTMHGDVKKAFRQGVAAGSATAFSEDLAQKELVQELIKEITVKEI